MKDHVDEVLRQWSIERPDLDASPMGVIGRISRLSRTNDRSIGAVLADHGLQFDEFDVLATLRRNGPPFRLTPTQLRSSTMVTSATMTNRLDKLERRSLIAREPDPDDRRGVLISLTAAGRALVDRAVTDHVNNEHGLLAGLSAAERKSLSNLLRKLSIASDEAR
jgi:DNA-binding MarR family transcriptional regulator